MSTNRKTLAPLVLALLLLATAVSAQTATSIEKIKAAKAEAEKQNALIEKFTAAQQARNWAEAAGLADQLAALDPANWEFREAQADTAFNLGKYDDAARLYDVAIGKLPDTVPERGAALGRMLANQGGAYVRLKKNAEAMASYQKASAVDPHPALALLNVCVLSFNLGNIEGARKACDQTIAADPTKADAYFIKGSLLFGDSESDVHGQLIPPPGTREALNKYLELAPAGPQANDVREMIAALAPSAPLPVPAGSLTGKYGHYTVLPPAGWPADTEARQFAEADFAWATAGRHEIIGIGLYKRSAPTVEAELDSLLASLHATPSGPRRPETVGGLHCARVDYQFTDERGSKAGTLVACRYRIGDDHRQWLAVLTAAVPSTEASAAAAFQKLLASVNWASGVMNDR